MFSVQGRWSTSKSLKKDLDQSIFMNMWDPALILKPFHPSENQ